MGFKKQSGGVINYLKIKGLKRDEPKHYFELNGEEIESNVFEGVLVGVDKDSYEYEGKIIKTIKLILQDEEQKYQLDISYNSIGRNIINSLAGTKDLKNIELSLYINKGGFKSIGIKNNGTRAEWKYSIDEQKELIELIVRKDGTKERDYFDLNKKLEDEIELINESVKNNVVEHELDKEVDGDSLPF